MIDWTAKSETKSGYSESNATIMVNTPTKADLLQRVAARLQNNLGFTIATLNLDHIVKLYESEQFFKAYSNQTYIVADGNPIVWLSRLAGRKIELVPGSELIDPLASLAAELKVPIAMFGSSQETLDQAAHQLKLKHPDLKVVAQISPPYGFNPEGKQVQEYLSELKSSGAKLCFLALGAPKQEIFSVYASQALPHCGFVSIGAGLDFIAGSQTRAPWIIRKLALEWLWRMLSSPRRLGYRYAACIVMLPKLFAQAIWSR